MADFLKSAFATSLCVSAIIAVFCVLRPFLSKHYHAKWQYWVWLCLALRLALPFNLPSDSAPIVLKPQDKLLYTQTAPITDSLQMAPSAQSEVGGTDVQIIEPSEEILADTPLGGFTQADANSVKPVHIMLSDLLFAIWIIGALALFIARICSYLLSRRVIFKQAKQINPTELSTALYELNIAANIAVCQSCTVTSPMLIGVFSPCIVLPCAEYSPSHLQMILRHELIHYKRHDIIYKCFMSFVCCFYWYNPLIWHMAHMAFEDIEISCDEAVVKEQSAEFKAAYANSIIKTIEKSYARRVLLSTSFSCGKKTVKQRLQSVFAAGGKRRGAITLVAVLALSLALSSIVACGTAADADNVGSQSTSAAQPAAAPELTSDMQALINAYEKYKSGNSFNAESVYQQGDFVFLIYGYLLDNGYKSGENCPFIDLDSKEACVRLNSNAFINEIDIKALSGFFTAIDTSKFTWHDIVGLTLTDIPLMPQLTLKNSTVLQNGDLQYTFERMYESKRLNDAVYTLREGKVEKVPPVFADKYKVGDTIYRLVSVSNIGIENSFPEKHVEIGTKSQLMDFARDYNSHVYDNVLCNVVLNADIDLADIEWIPIGINTPITTSDAYDATNRDGTLSGFNGSFDGQGYTIYNLSCSYNGNLPEGERYGCGLFSLIGAKGSVKNLNIENASVNGMGKNMYTYANSGILAAELHGKITNCNVDGAVTSVCATGGLVGVATSGSAIADCTADVDVRSSVYAGALVGTATESLIYNCSAKGSLTAFESDDKGWSMGTPAGIGGFIGESYGNNISDCHVDVRLIIEADGYGIGSFIGVARYISAGQVKNSTYTKKSTGAWRPIGLLEDKKPTENPNYQLSGI
ncbi:MAG: M56 family metallopeptidase [Oscillospiraceae bacterium]